MKKNLVLFDFDGTLTQKDTFFQFIFFTCGTFKTIMGFIVLSPLVLFYFVKIVSASSLKQKILSFFFKEKSYSFLNEKGKSFINYLHASGNLKTEIIVKMKEYQEAGDKVCVVSASPDIWIRPFAAEYIVNYICTELEYEKEKFSGQFKTKNCNGPEKAIRIKEKYKLSDFNEIIAYGNSKGDKEMFDLADKRLYIR